MQLVACKPNAWPHPVIEKSRGCEDDRCSPTAQEVVRDKALNTLVLTMLVETGFNSVHFSISMPVPDWSRIVPPLGAGQTERTPVSMSIINQ